MKFLRKRNFFSLFIVVSFLFFSEKIFSQETASPFSFHHYTEDEGLDNQNINCLLQDTRGFIWIGTSGGLFRFDGYQFKSFRHSEIDTQSISQNLITSLAEDNSGKIWVGTNGNGLNCFNPQTGIFYHYQLNGKNKNEKSGRINSIACSTDGKIYASCDLFRGIYLFNTQTNQFKNFDFEDFNFINFNNHELPNCYALRLVNNDTLIIGTMQGLFQCDFTNKNVALIELYNYDRTGANSMHCISIKRNPYSGNYFIGTWGNGIKELNLKTKKSSSYWSDPAPPVRMGSYNIITDFEFMSAHEIFISNMSGQLSLLNTKTNNFLNFTNDPTNNFSVPEGICHCSLKDNNGNFWFGFENGLVTFNPLTQRFHNIFFNKEESEASVNDLSESSNGDSIFLATSLSNGIKIYDKSAKYLTGLKTKPNDYGVQYVLSSCTDIKNNIWFSSTTGWYKYDSDKNKFEEKADTFGIGLITGNRAVYNGIGNSIILQLGKRTVLLVDPLNDKTIFQKRLNYPLADSNQVSIQSIYFSADNNYWVIYHYAIIEYNSSFEILRTIPATIKNGVKIGEGHLFSLVIDHNNNLFVISTDGSLTSINTKSNAIKTYDSRYMMSPERCTGITIDKSGTIWISCEKGIIRFDPVAEKFIQFDKSDGLPTKRIDYIKHQNSGRVYYFFNHGWGYFSPDSFLPKKNNSPVIFTSFKINEIEQAEDINFKNELTVDYLHNNLSFEFSHLNFTNPKNNTYAYQFIGLNDNWIEISTRHQINFNLLAPGIYLLRICAADNNGVRSSSIHELKITVTPPWWQTWLFRILVFIAFALAIYFLFKLKLRIARREVNLKSNYQKKISELETKALRAQMNPHFIFNCLNSINSFILRNDTDVASEYLTKFSRLIRLVLDNSRTSVISLSSELECLKLFIEMEEMRFANKFDYSIHVDEKLNTETIKVPPLVFQPYVENSIWHGLLHKNEKGNLRIEISEQSGFTICVIEDNGIGREAAREAKSKSSGHRKSHGMGITSQRVIEWNQDNEAAVKISDLYDEEKKPAGTRVEIKLKIHSEN